MNRVYILSSALLISAFGALQAFNQKDVDLVKNRNSAVYQKNGKPQWANGQYADLQGANLDGVNLDGANLQYAILVKASLVGAHLKGANLKQAHPLWANFTNADLTDANLHAADFEGANLTNADLTNANLTYAVFLIATIQDTNFQGAIFHRTDNSGVKGTPRNLNTPKELIKKLEEDQQKANTNGDYTTENEDEKKINDIYNSMKKNSKNHMGDHDQGDDMFGQYF